mgnify:CR=1 FL=1
MLLVLGYLIYLISYFVYYFNKEYKKKNILICGDIDTEEIRKLDGVNKIIKERDGYIVSIEDESYVNKVFKCVSKFDNITKFSVEDPSLNEIFINIVGECYDK